MKKFISIILVLSMSLCYLPAKIDASYKNSNIDQSIKSKYIIKSKKTDDYISLKKKFKKQDKIIINHKRTDENYLADSQAIVVEISKKEAQEYMKNKDLIVEEDYKISASNKKFQTLHSKNLLENLSSKTKTEIELAAKSVAPPSEELNHEEYSDNPENFVPCEAITDPEKINEIVPWNISCVANIPSENKYKEKNIKVAIIDSGIDTHNDLNTAKWIDFSDKVEGYKPIDNSGHGTSIAGVIAARINGFGIEGIASESELYSLKVLNEDNTASVSTVIKAIEWCIENNIDIINMSFGMDQYSEILAKEITKANNSGILMIAAAGNNVKDIQYPAKYPEVISVGSINKQLLTSEFSDNTNVDLVAPGEDAQTTGYIGSFCITSGTSVAAAHVTGVAAAVKSAKKTISNTDLKKILINSGIVLVDGSRMINYDNAIHLLEKNNLQKTTLPEIKEEIFKKENNQNSYVEGSWSSETWKGTNNSMGTGHYSLMNKLPLSYFGNNSENDTEKTINKSIAADAAWRIDILDWTSASSELGKAQRNSNGYIDTSLSGHCYAPYHAKAQYDMGEVLNHMFFLYELARRRLILGSNLNLDPTSYSGDKYYSVYIGQKMKRRIIVDLSAMYDHQSIVFGGSIDMNTVRHKGYMVLGVFLHLVQDIQAHRAKVTSQMLYGKADGTVYYGYDTMTNSAADSRICGSNIIGVSSGNFDEYWKLYSKIKADGSIPMNKLKKFLNENININCNGSIYMCSKSQAYEDNPNFYSDRYNSAYTFTQAYINRMYSDTGATSTQLNTYYAVDSVPLYMNKYSN